MVKAQGQLRVLAVTGGSGGHVFPALAFCEECGRQGVGSAAVTLVVALRGRAAADAKLREMLRSSGDPIVLEAPRSIPGFLRLFITSFSLVRRIRPDVVIGFGGYACVPFLWWAWLTGRKTFLHEQNVVPGQANRLVGLFVSRIAVTFDASAGYFARRRHVIPTRFPLRSSLRRLSREEAESALGLQPGLVNVLVMGGSQGARRLNDLFLAALKKNRDLAGLQVVHLSGEKQAAEVEGAYARLGVSHRVLGFLADIHQAYSVADLVVSRAGAGAVVELMFFGLPSILVPYPHAAGHQTGNARVLAEAGAAFLIEESRWTEEMFNGLLDILRRDPMRRKTMAHIATELYHSSSRRSLSEVVLS